MSKNPASPLDPDGSNGETAQSRRLWDLALGVASCGHDLNNWLTLAVSNLELAQAGIGEPIEELELCRMALAGAIALVQGELRGHPEDDESCDIAAAIEGVLRLGRPLWSAHLVIEREVLPMPRAIISRRHVQRVLLNLIINAAAAVPEGGTITVRAWPAGDTVVIEVHDSGPGFPADMLGADVQPFTSTHALGSGLGLAGSALLARRAGGSLVLDTHTTGGAVVRLTVPAVFRTMAG